MENTLSNLVHLKGVRGAIAKKMIHSLQSSA
ncbi:MAG: hypothetical protein ACI90A_000942, partial [Shewanella sp.]